MDQYATLIESLMNDGYEQRGKAFQLVRNVTSIDDGPPIDVVVDFLRPTDAEIVKNTPPLVSDFAVIRGSGVGLALQFYNMVAIAGRMPAGGNNRVEIAVASIPALLVMKGFAIKTRFKRKDAYDIHYSIRNYPGGITALAAECLKLLTVEDAVTAFGYISEKFDEPDSFGPTCVRLFVELANPGGPDPGPMATGRLRSGRRPAEGDGAARLNALTFVTKDRRKVKIVFDWEDQVTILNAAGAQIGNLNHRQLDDDAPSEVRLIHNMYLEGEDAGGPYKMQGVMGFVFAALIDKGYTLLVRHHDGLGREDGSELTQDAPGFIAHMAAKGLVRRYEGP